MKRILAGLWLFLTVLCGTADAHDLRPAYLAITETASANFDVLWKSPALGDLRLAIYPKLPASVAETAPREGMFLNDAYVERWTVHAPSGFAGETIAIDGLAASRTDVLVRIENLSGEARTARLTPSQPSFVVPAAAGAGDVATAYLWLGVEHILMGVDHLLFVLGLLLLLGSWQRISLTITAFTVAHSVTLAAATLGVVQVSERIVNTLIALSILFLAVEIARAWRGETGLTTRHPWIVAFGFGLLHGFGFATGLTGLGLPAADIPLALLFFNLGVEAGQLAFVALILLLAQAFRVLSFRWNSAVAALPVYTIGTAGAYWTIERIAPVLMESVR